jgi:HAE1 family hydrophobic/amphiphilic exporter-1
MLLSNIAIDRPVFTTMVMLALIVFGIVSYSRLGIDREPKVDFPFLTITTVYPGADPETVETEIIDRIEDELMTLSGIKMMESRALENIGFVVLEYELDVDPDLAAQDLRAKLDGLRREFPEDVESPIVEKFDMGAAPIVSLAISADMPLTNLTKFAEDRIKPKLEAIDGVGSAKLVGGRNREIQIKLDPEAMKARNIGIDEVVGLLKASNLEIPGGRIETGTRELVVKTKGRIPEVSQFGEIILRSTPMGTVRLKDISDIDDTLEEKRSLARLDGEDAIALVVTKKSGGNTIKVAEKIMEAVKELQQTLPPGIKFTVPADDSLFIRSSFESLLHDLIYGCFWATIIVFFFLQSPRSTLICGVAIPTSIIGTFIFMHVMDFTLNMVSMVALSSCVGMLIDDAIVVLENINRHINEGETPIEAAKNATAQIGLAVMATTFSIAAVFVPVAYTYGLVGRFLYEFGTTVSAAVLISLFVSFTLTPMLSSKFLTKTDYTNRFYKALESGISGMERSYRWFLAKALRYKGTTVLIAFLIFIFSIYLGRFIPQEFQPVFDENMFAITVTTPPGSPIKVIEEKIVEIEKRMREMPEVRLLFSTVGSGSTSSVQEGTIQVALVPRLERDNHQTEIMKIAREKIQDIPGAKFSVGRAFSFGGGGELEVVLISSDLDLLIENSDKLISTWKKEPGFVDIDMSYEAGKPELRIIADRDRASATGLNMYGIASAVNGMLSGETAITTFKEKGYDYDLKVRLKEPFRNEPTDLLSLPIRSAMGNLVDLGSVARVEAGSGPSEINHRGGQRSVSVWTNLEGIKLGPAKEKTAKILDQILPPEVSYTFSGMSDIMEESFQSLFFAMALAIILVYMILCSQYEHLIHPLSIMFSLPLSIIGAFGLLFITQATMSIMTMIGLIMLMGVVTKNAILLVDFTNQLRKEGMSREDALLKAGPIRLKPILMTTLSTIFGLLPVALSKGTGAEMNVPMALCIIGGLSTSTLLTLLVVPVVYSILDIWTQKVLRIFKRS